MNNNRLRYFIVVNETESIRKAAETLHISPAALSKAIKQLEIEMGVTLLIPAGRGIMITDAGRHLAQQAEPLIAALERLKKDVKDKNKSHLHKPIRIGSFEVFTTHFLTNLIDSLPEKNDLFLHEFMPGEMEKNLVEHNIDYGITYLPIPTAGIAHLQITHVDMQIFGRKKHFEHIPFAGLPFVIPVQPLLGSPNKVQGLDGWPDGCIERLVKYRVATMESALQLCRQGKAVAYLPSFVVNLHNQTVKPEYNLQSIPFSTMLPTQKQAVYLIKRKSEPNDIIFKKITQALRTIYQSYS